MLTIHQAIFGDKAEGYGLLSATCSIELARRIANATDIHEQTPDGIIWSYTLRGLAWGDEHFLLMRTFVDKSPNVRQGRVYTHCLIIPVNSLNLIEDLRSLLYFLPVDIEKGASLTPIDFKIENKNLVQPTSRTNCLIKSLATGNTDLVGWVDYEDYENALILIWGNVSSAIRRELRFGIAFSPTDSKARPGIKILTVPSQLANRWKADGITIISKNEACVLDTDAEKILAGDTRDNNLFAFIEEAGISVNKISDYSHIQTIFKTASNLAKADLNSLLTLLNTLTVYNSQSQYLQQLNENTADQIINRLSKGGLKEIIRVRNEDFQHLLSAKRENEISLVIEKNLSDLQNSNDSEIIDLFAQLIKSSVKDWWKITTKSGLKSLFNKQFNRLTGLILKLINEGESEIVELLDHLVSTNSNQLVLITKLKTDKTFVKYDVLSIWAVKRHWLQLHAMCMIHNATALSALEAQVNIDPSYTDEEAFKLIVNFYNFNDILKAGQSLDLDFTTKLIAGLCIKSKKNRDALNIAMPYSQIVLLSMLDQGWEFPSDNEESTLFFTDILNLIVEGGSVNNRLLTIISKNLIANIFSFSRRREIWAKLPEPLRTKLIKDTALYYMGNEDFSDYNSLEFELGSTITNLSTITEFVEANKSSMAKVLPIFDILVRQESYVQDYVSYYAKALTITESVLLGQLVNRKNWRNCAKEIYNKSNYNVSFKDALSECYELLGIFDRLSLSFNGSLKYHSISDNEWWQALKEIAIELFPEGPKQKKIWEEAGGKTQDLNLTGNGREQWSYAINSLKNGGSGIKPKHLLNAMMTEFNNNPHLRLLRSWLKQD